AELLARVQVLTRRGPKARAFIRVGPLELDTVAMRARVLGRGDCGLHLRRREDASLEYLSRPGGTSGTRAGLEAHVYNEERWKIASNAIDSAVCAIRAKLVECGCPPLIQTRRAVGYVLEAEVDDP